MEIIANLYDATIQTLLDSCLMLHDNGAIAANERYLIDISQKCTWSGNTGQFFVHL